MTLKYTETVSLQLLILTRIHSNVYTKKLIIYSTNHNHTLFVIMTFMSNDSEVWFSSY
jgi:hypothetical protein